MKRLLIGSLLLAFAIPIGFGKGSLDNYGVKNRSIGATVTSKAAGQILEENTYTKTAELTPWVKEAAKTYRLPANVLLAILYEEIAHRKPVDVSTFGVAQIGLNELVEQGLPPDIRILDDDRLCVWILARKLVRLQRMTGSLQSAITLHNGYYDYLPLIQLRAKDPRILQLLQERRKYPVVWT
jgi:hypothetical protein